MERAPFQRPLASTDWFEQLVVNSSDFLVVLDEQAMLTYANPASGHHLGLTRPDLSAHQSLARAHPEDRRIAIETFVEVLSHGGSSPPIVVRIMGASGQWRYIEMVMTNCLHDSSINGVVLNGYDVTERMHLTRALRSLFDVHKIIVNAVDEASLLEDVCRALVANDTISLAWIAHAATDEWSAARVAASAGATELIEVDPAATNRELHEGIIGQVSRGAPAKVLRDLRSEAGCGPWWDRCVDQRRISACVFPLAVGEDTFATLILHCDELGVFDDDQVELFRELAGEIAYGVGRLRDAERLTRQEQLLRDSEQRFRLAFEANAAPMLFSDLKDRVIAVNDAFCRMIGYSRAELLGHDSKQFTHPEDVGITEDSLVRLLGEDADQVRYVKRYVRKDGATVTAEVSRSPARDERGEILYFVASERDVTEERALAEQLSHQALHDPLTGLANRTLFEDRLNQAQLRARRRGGFGAVLLLDLDDFKAINDTYGHLAGDELLGAFTRRLGEAARSSDTLARFGGDEFLYLAEDLERPEEAGQVANRFLDALAAPFEVAGVVSELRVSIGVATFDGGDAEVGELMRDADLALYAAKQQGKSRFVAFEPSMRDEAADCHELTRELKDALVAGELEVRYQPIVDLSSGAVVGFEALSRFSSPTRGPVLPSEVVHLVEGSEFALDFSAYTIARALEAAGAWRGDGEASSAPFVSVNVTARAFLDPGFAGLVTSALAGSGLEGSALVVEIAEAVTHHLAGTRHVIAELRRLGVRVALDDFGTGSSSLSSLAALCPDIVKIDVPIVAGAHGPEGRALVQGVVAFASGLAMTALAEGVETAASLEAVRELGCSLGQGFLFAEAIDAEEAARLVVAAVAGAGEGPYAGLVRECTAAAKSSERSSQLR